LTTSQWIETHYEILGQAVKRIAGGSHLSEDLLSETVIAFLEHKNAQTIVDSGGAFFYTLKIAMNLWKSQTSPFYKNYKHAHSELLPSHENIPDTEEEEAGIFSQIDSIIDKELSWYESKLLMVYIDERRNASALSRKTGIPRTSITLTINRIRKHVQERIIYE
jgi:DNA-directed RNA polymerase specialized sigma24 family protein